MTKITIYKIETQNTRPRGFGRKPVYKLDKQQSDEANMKWVSEIEISIPDGYSITKSESGENLLFDNNGRYVEIEEFNNRPAIAIMDSGSGRIHWQYLD